MIRTSNEIIKVTFSIPRYIIEDLRHNTDNMSRYVSEAVIEKLESEKREKAIQELLAYPSTYTDVDDSVEYINNLRSLDHKRLKELYESTE
jgi:hypothetical protein